MTKEPLDVWAEFDEKFGKDGRYLCQYDPDMETHTSNHEDVKAFIRERFVPKAALREKVEGLKERAQMLGQWSKLDALDAVISLIDQP